MFTFMPSSTSLYLCQQSVCILDQKMDKKDYEFQDWISFIRGLRVQVLLKILGNARQVYALGPFFFELLFIST